MVLLHSCCWTLEEVLLSVKEVLNTQVGGSGCVWLGFKRQSAGVFYPFYSLLSNPPSE